MIKRDRFLLGLVGCFLAASDLSAEAIRALMISGGCCHDYPNQNLILSEGISRRAHVEWTLVNQGGDDRNVKIPLYDNPNWAKGYDVIVHNECFGGVDDADWLERIVNTHTEGGIPAVFIHCSLHSYRGAETDAWRKLMGARSMNHERHRPLEVVNLLPQHPIMKSFPATWSTPAGELYKIMEMFPDARPLAKAFGQDTQMDHVCVWVNQLGSSKVFTTTLGHHNVTMKEPVYLDLVTRGLLWTVDRLEADGSVDRRASPRRLGDVGKRKVLAADYHKKRIAIVDAEGQVEWEYPIDDIHYCRVLPNGNILFQTDWTHLVEMTRDHRVVWEYDATLQNREGKEAVEIHAFQRLPNGLTMIAESGPARIIEVDRTGRIHREIRLKVDNPHPHRDTRMVEKLASGHYLVCHEADGMVREYSDQGDVVWEYRTGAPTYGATRLANGNTLIGNGGGHNVLEVSPGGQVLWSLDSSDLPGLELVWVTNVEELPNGNFLIGNCHAGEANPQILEVTRGKEVVWSFRDFKTFGNALPISHVFRE